MLDFLGLRLRAARMFWSLTAIFYLNDLLFIWASGHSVLYLMDWALRCAVLMLFLIEPHYRQVAMSAPLSKPKNWYSVLVLICALVGLGHMALVLIEPLVVGIFGSTRLFHFGRIESTPIRVIDLTIGLMLVAISEELVFRKFALHWLRGAGFGVVASILISAAVFATMHWGSGLEGIASTFVFGVITMAVYIRYDRLLPLIGAHYLLNFIVFA